MAIAKLSIDLEARLASFERDMATAARTSEKTAKRMESAFSGLGVAAAGAAAWVGASGLVAEVKRAINDLDKLNDAAEQVGLSVESLSALSYAGKMSGLEFDDMTMAVTKLSVKMQEAVDGSAEAANLFKDVGVNVLDSSGKMKSADIVLAEIADRFSNFKDGAAKTALAVDLFGRSGAKLVPLLNSGADGLEKMRQEAESLGGIIDGKLARQAADFNDNLDRLQTLSSAAAKSMTADLLPALNGVAERFLIGARSIGGFTGGISMFIDGTASAGDQIKSLKNELTDLNAARERYLKFGGDTSGIDTAISTINKKIKAYKELQIIQSLAGASENYGNEGRSRGSVEARIDIKRTKTAGGDGKPGRRSREERPAGFADYDQQVAQRIADAIDKTDVVKAATLVRELQKLDELAAAGLDPAIVKAVRDDLSGAAKVAADEMSRLNKFLGETPSGKMEAARNDMEFLTAALVEARISEEQYLEAVIARLDLTAEKTKEVSEEMDEFAKSAAKNIQSTLADFLFDPFSDGLDGMAQKFGQVIQRMIADAAAAQLARSLFGEMGTTGKIGGWAGDLIKAFGFHEGGTVGAAGSETFTRAVPASMFARARRYHSGGLVGDEVPAILKKGELVLTKDQQRGMQGVTASVNQTLIFNGAAEPTQVKRAAAAGYRQAAGIMSAARRYT